MSIYRKTATILTSLALLCIVISCQSGFTGSRIANPDYYALSIKRMHGTDRHTLKLKAGDALHIQLAAEKESLNLEITAPDGTVIYTGNGKGASDFTVNISQDGAYAITVEAHHAKGSIHIQQVKPDMKKKT